MTIIQTAKPLAKRRKADFYPTPRAFCDQALALVNMTPPDIFRDGYVPELHILDPGCGTGVWGQAAQARWPHAVVDGAEVRDIKKPEGYRHIYKGDFCLFDHGLDYDLVIGNPPFYAAELFVRNGLANLSEDGTMLYLLPLRFLEGKGRARGLFRHSPPKEVWVAGRISFQPNGKTDDTAYAIYIWQKGWRGTPSLKWMMR